MSEANGPIYAWIDEDGDVLVIGEQTFPGAPPVAARTMVVVETREEAIAIRDALLRGDAPDVDIAGPSAYTPDSA